MIQLSIYSFKLSNLTQAQPLSFGTPIENTFGGGKTTNLYQFEGIAGERFFFDYQTIIGSRGSSYSQWRLIDPEGNEVFDQGFTIDASDITVPSTGTYTLLVENSIYDYPRSSSFESIDYRFQAEKIAPTVDLTLGETVTNKLTTDTYSFSLEDDSLLYFDALLNNDKFKWSLTDTDGTEIVNQRLFTRTDANNISNPVLNVSAGDYLLKIDGDDVNVNYAFKLSNLNQAEQLSFGTPIEDTFGEGKTTNLYQFEGTAGEKYFFDYQTIIGSRGSSYSQWRLIDPEGNEVFDQGFTTDASDITVPSTGTYTLLVENSIYDYPRSSSFESIDYRFQVEKIAPTVDLTLGETVTNKLTTDTYSFNLENDSLLYFRCHYSTMSSFKWSLTEYRWNGNSQSKVIYSY